MTTPIEKNLTIYQGATFRQSWDLTQNNSPLDLAGWTARMQIRQKIASDTVIHELTTENGGINIDVQPDYTRLSLYIAPADTAAIMIKSAVYDLELVDTAGDVFRFFKGTVTIDPEVTR